MPNSVLVLFFAALTSASPPALSGDELTTTDGQSTVLWHCDGKSSDCGWQWVGLGHCAPGRPVSLILTPPGRHSDLRVCEGELPCGLQSAHSLERHTKRFPAARFRCPSSGVYTVLARDQVATTLLRASAGTFPLKPPLTSDQRRLIFGRDAKGNGTLFSVDDGQVEHGPSAEYSLYHVNYWNGGETKPWLPWCQPDREGVAKAIPLQGAWDATGTFVDDDSQLTFACTSGVLAKCVRWGYPPWATSHGRSLKTLHQACTRMARADYCGTGKPHTRDGTPIWFSDLENLNRAQASPTAGAFEASWGPDGAVCVRRARWYETLAELEKECPEKLAGRVGSTCHPAFDGGVLVNSSLIQPPEP